MAFSGSISTATFNALKVVETAFRRCRLPAQSITAEMQVYALEALYLFLSDLANRKPPSWCIERQVYPFYAGQPVLTLERGTVDVLNANLRILQEVTGTVDYQPLAYTVVLDSAAAVNVIGIKWSGPSVALVFETSDDGLIWAPVGLQATVAVTGAWTWTDITPAVVKAYFRVTSVLPLRITEAFLGTMPQEIPLGPLNRDDYVAQSNRVYLGRPLTYWFQRDLPTPVLNLWPAPNQAAEHQQLVVWRHRHIMDTENLRQDVEVPQRWLEAIVAGLAMRVADETPTVDIALLPRLDLLASQALQNAWDGDNDGSSTFIQPRIGAYTQ